MKRVFRSVPIGKTSFLKLSGLLITIVIVTLIGVHFFGTGRAATPYTMTNAASGTLSGTASLESLTGASNGAAVVFGGSSGSTTTLHNNYGYFADLEYQTGSQLSTTLQSWKDAGAKYARFQMKWSTIQAGGPNSYNWSEYDSVVADILADDMIPLPVVGDTPSWAYPSNCTSSEVCAPATQYESAFGTFLNAAATRYSGKITDWEIWNEANNPTFWQPAPNPVEYTALLETAYTGIHAAEPNATVISSGLAPGTDTQGGGWISPVTFLTDIYNNGGGSSFDAVGWHPYTWPTDPSVQNSGLSWYEMVNDARSIMAAHGDSGKAIWATEFGAPTCTGSSRCESEADQASSIQSAITMWKSYSWSGPLIIYTYEDTCSDETNPECYFGVVNAAGQSKPALSTLESNY